MLRATSFCVFCRVPCGNNSLKTCLTSMLLSNLSVARSLYHLEMSDQEGTVETLTDAPTSSSGGIYDSFASAAASFISQVYSVNSLNCFFFGVILVLSV